MQACRTGKGEDITDSGTELVRRGRTEVDGPIPLDKEEFYVVPNQADFLFAYSTFEGSDMNITLFRL